MNFYKKIFFSLQKFFWGTKKHWENKNLKFGFNTTFLNARVGEGLISLQLNPI